MICYLQSMKRFKIQFFLLILFLFFSTPVLAEGQNGIVPLIILIGIGEVIAEALVIGLLLKFILGFLKVNISYKTAFLISGSFAALSELLKSYY
ncbi:MAG: hypothetical protein JWR05_105 [Mucilaginibacter sp.]|nr:hypothetical protein [Mucilaginibacter sp.]